MSAALLLIYCTLVPAGAGIDYSIYDDLTKRFVDDRGLVNYAGLKGEIESLRRFVYQLAASSPENRPELFTDDEALRYYLTA